MIAEGRHYLCLLTLHPFRNERKTFIQNAFLSFVNNGCIVVKGVNVWLEFVCPLTSSLSVCRIHVYTIGLVHPWSRCTCRWERIGESSGNSLVTRLSCWSHWPLGGNSEMRGERGEVKGRERASIMERKEDHCFPPAQPFKSSSPFPPPSSSSRSVYVLSPPRPSTAPPRRASVTYNLLGLSLPFF